MATAGKVPCLGFTGGIGNVVLLGFGAGIAIAPEPVSGGSRRSQRGQSRTEKPSPRWASVAVEGFALTLAVGRVSAIGTATATCDALTLPLDLGVASATGVQNLTDEELVLVLLGMTDE